MTKRVALIMAGGKGTRLWPLSTEKKPKQFISLFSEERTLIQNTFDRINRIIGEEDIYVCTSSEYRSLVKEQLPQIPDENIILEPCGRNTAPAICVSSLYIKEKNAGKDDIVLMIFPSDHYIEGEECFGKNIESACREAENGHLAVLGIRPTRPETGFGYIKLSDSQNREDVLVVDKFVEKPKLETAQRYMREGIYFWNAGIFIWSIKTLISEMRLHAPKLLDDVALTLEEGMINGNLYSKVESISIDYALMEHSKNIRMVPGTFLWNDVGSFDAIYELSEKDKDGNVIHGSKAKVDSCKNCLISFDSGVLSDIRLSGLENVIAVSNNQGIFISGRKKAEHEEDCH